MKKLSIFIILSVFLLTGCPGTVIKRGETTWCPAPAYPEFTKSDNSTHVGGPENLAILGDNLNKLKAWADDMRNNTIPCYEKQVPADKIKRENK